MGNLILISGENGSGKSVFAEKTASSFGGKLYYIATMIPETADDHARIEKHKKQREGLGFTTLELPYGFSDVKFKTDPVILLEDVSNLLANNIFEKKKTADEVFDDIQSLAEKCKVVVAVTISGLKNDGYDEETAMYIDSLNKINKRLYDKASAAVKMIDGKPVFIKGEIYDIY